MAASSAAAMQLQTEQNIPFREDYFLPEDEAGATGTIRRDEVSSEEEDAQVKASSPQTAGKRVGCLEPIALELLLPGLLPLLCPADKEMSARLCHSWLTCQFEWIVCTCKFGFMRWCNAQNLSACLLSRKAASFGPYNLLPYLASVSLLRHFRALGSLEQL